MQAIFVDIYDVFGNYHAHCMQGQQTNFLFRLRGLVNEGMYKCYMSVRWLK